MPKAKKSDSEKIAKPKSLKPVKADKPDKEKKGKKKEKTVVAAPAPAKPLPTPMKAAKKPAAAKPAKVTTPEIVFSTEEISLRAYFIAERRQAMGWPGDSAHDWLEAERQLKAEAKKKAKG